MPPLMARDWDGPALELRARPLSRTTCHGHVPAHRRRATKILRAAMARGKYPFPSRTGQSRPAAPMVLGPQPGRVGRRPTKQDWASPHKAGAPFSFLCKGKENTITNNDSARTRTAVVVGFSVSCYANHLNLVLGQHSIPFKMIALLQSTIQLICLSLRKL